MANRSEEPVADTVLQKYISIAQELEDASACPAPLQVILRHPAEDSRSRYFVLFYYIYSSYNQSNSISLLQEAIAIGRHLIQLGAQSGGLDDTNRIMVFQFMSSMAQAFQIRFYLLHDQADLERTIKLRRRLISMVPEDTSEQKLNDVLRANETSLCIGLNNQFKRENEYQVISEAISFGRSAIRRTDKNHVDMPLCMSNLATVLLSRFRAYATDEDLESCIDLFRTAVQLAERNQQSPFWLSYFQHNLASALHDEMWRKPEPEDTLNLCMDLVEKSLSSTPQNAPLYPLRIYSLSIYYFERFRITGQFSDVDRAMTLLEHLPLDHTVLTADFRFELTQSRMNMLIHRYMFGKNVADLDKTISIGRQALDEQHKINDPSFGILLICSYIFRAVASGVDKWWETGDADEAQRLTLELAGDSSRGHSRLQSMFKCEVARLNHLRGSFDVALRAYQDALKFLPQGLLVMNQYRTDDIEGAREANVGVDAAACALACGNPGLAVELLEQGRSIGWTRSLQMRSDVEQLRAEYPESARRLAHFARQCEISGTSPSQNPQPAQTTTNHHIDTPQWEDRFSYFKQWESLVAEIRELDGYESFLSPPKYEELRSAATCGPVVIVNVSTYRHGSAALIIGHSTLDRPQIVPLPRDLETKAKIWFQVLSEGTNKLASGQISERNFNQSVLNPILAGLWREIVVPIRQTLRILDPYARRIWWCPTGPLTFLPLHVVTNGPSGGIEGMSTLIPSYTTTVSSLLRASTSRLPPQRSQPPKVLAIACEVAEGHSDLPGALREIESIKRIIPSDSLDILTDTDATKDRVMSSLSDHSWLHLACHGHQENGKPFDSHFVLHDGPLRISDIISQNLKNSEFAFLSACHTASGWPAMFDESMHLAAALQFIGFRAVIATQWAVDDNTAARLAQEVYSYLFLGPGEGRSVSVEDTAEALHYAVATLRRQGVPFSRLAPFIHIGV
ncbi:hypothetical protein BD410DRAFT_896734 [Rickenella mellea]|uniref:CHAT domain-containing protein n=1 Tax=Rickenella mellea TaxID=50990 RepID=A0A4Y7QBS9_9AGAM|nr:hypothetical protein BD410DRAFT_896734 [Rickenella mellea]